MFGLDFMSLFAGGKPTAESMEKMLGNLGEKMKGQTFLMVVNNEGKVRIFEAETENVSFAQKDSGISVKIEKIQTKKA